LGAVHHSSPALIEDGVVTDCGILAQIEPFAAGCLTARSRTPPTCRLTSQGRSVQNLTLSITRNLTRKNFTEFDINQPNFLQNGLFEAFEAARMGGESALLRSGSLQNPGVRSDRPRAMGRPIRAT
jgi:hypothetical protein